MGGGSFARARRARYNRDPSLQESNLSEGPSPHITEARRWLRGGGPSEAARGEAPLEPRTFSLYRLQRTPGHTYLLRGKVHFCCGTVPGTPMRTFPAASPRECGSVSLIEAADIKAAAFSESGPSPLYGRGDLAEPWNLCLTKCAWAEARSLRAEARKRRASLDARSSGRCCGHSQALKCGSCSFYYLHQCFAECM